MLAIDPADCAPYLDAFRHDKGLSHAILIEYLPKPLAMNCVTYTKERMQKAVNGIRQIHFDAYIGKKERDRIEFETEVIESFG
jgi:hypothetical protein